MIKFSESVHWYTGEGLPQHDADLRVARKQGLHASVTTIDKAEFKNDFLERWKMNELVGAAADNPRQPHEDREAYANRIYELSLQKGSDAADFGKLVHAAIEGYPQMPIEPEAQPFFKEFADWYAKNFSDRIAAEHVMVDPDTAVAGMGDFKGIHLVHGLTWADWKTQNVKKDDKGRKKPNFYDSWGRQLAFYAVTDAKLTGMFPAIPTCMSVVIDSNEPCEPFVKVWSQDEIRSSYEDFVIAAYRWHKKRNYWPKGRWSVIPDIPMPE